MVYAWILLAKRKLELTVARKRVWAIDKYLIESFSFSSFWEVTMPKESVLKFNLSEILFYPFMFYFFVAESNVYYTFLKLYSTFIIPLRVQIMLYIFHQWTRWLLLNQVCYFDLFYIGKNLIYVIVLWELISEFILTQRYKKLAHALLRW